MNCTTCDYFVEKARWDSISTLVIAALTLVLNIHQSYQFKHLHSKCFRGGVECCDVAIESGDEIEGK